MKNQILITGATGFIGFALLQRLSREKYRIKVLIRKKHPLRDVTKFADEVIMGDLTDEKSMEEAVGNCQLVFNCAASLPYHNLKSSEYWRVNVLGTKNVVDSAIRQKAKQLIHLSTVGIFGETKGIYNEDSPINLKSVYSKTKYEAEKLVTLASKKGLITTIIRPTIAYGPGDIRPGFLNLFQLIKKGWFIPIGDGENYFHTIYIDNLIDAILNVIENKKAFNEDFIIGDDPCPKMKQLIKAFYKSMERQQPNYYLPKNIAAFLGLIGDMNKKIGLPAPLSSQRVKFITENKRFDVSKAKRLIDYKAQVFLEEGAIKTYKWYLKNNYI